MKTKLTEREVLVLSAFFALTNMGQRPPEREEVKRLLDESDTRWKLTLDGAVTSLCQQFMESDEHYDIFMGEAKMWKSRQYFGGKYNNREAILKTWPDVKKAFWPESP